MSWLLLAGMARYEMDGRYGRAPLRIILGDIHVAYESGEWVHPVHDSKALLRSRRACPETGLY